MEEVEINFMKILVIMGFLDSLIDSLVRPITQLEIVQEVLVVRYWPSIVLPKTRYKCPPSFISRFPVLATFYKLFIMIYLSLINKPDFIHSFRLFPHGIMAFIGGKLIGRPVGVTLNAGAAELYGLSGNPLGIDYSQPIPKSGKFYLWMLKHCNAILVLNSSTKKFLTIHGISEGKVFILPQPVNIDKYKPMSIPKRYDVISVGRLIPVKHNEVLLKAIAIVKQSRLDIKVGIVGDGSSRGFLEELAVELNISNNVEFLGFSEDTPYYYNSAKVFALTSEREGGPLTFTEAMACGIPPIASQCGIVTDVGKDGENCIIIKDLSDVDAFAHAIIRLSEDNELYEKLSRNAFKTSRSITIERAMQVWEKIFERCYNT